MPNGIQLLAIAREIGKKVDELKIKPLSWDWHVTCPKEHGQKKDVYHEAGTLHNERIWWYEKCRKETAILNCSAAVLKMRG